ncbi:hypothetical protein GOBAR_DD28176 [Gossypium barbadense]|nr:hypothetical protein GOBAR_DD28176 [Gossypium barbadense]
MVTFAFVSLYVSFYHNNLKPTVADESIGMEASRGSLKPLSDLKIFFVKSPPPPTVTTLINLTANSVKPLPPLSPPSSSSSCHNQRCREGPVAVAGVVSARALFLALFAGALIWVYSKKFKHE